MKTYSAKPGDVQRKWYVVDATSAPLGRLATTIATYLTGKHKPMYTPHIDCGDFIIVTNAEQVVVTGKKTTDKIYYRYSGFPGGLKTRSLQEQLDKDPKVIIEAAVKGMLPKNKLSDERLKRLKVFVGSEHTHTPQQPEALNIKQTTEVKNG
jgi:large subunit ribosomal protein L13